MPKKPRDRPLPPVSALDRTPGGDHLGPCPQCGGLRWWDNRGRKRSGQWKKTAPDYTCADKKCGYAIWPSELEQREKRAKRRLERRQASANGSLRAS